MHLCEASLAALRGRLDAPSYDRTLLRPAIVHIGVGGFHRAHQTVYLDALARAGNLEWGETGAGLRSRAMLAACSGRTASTRLSSGHRTVSAPE